MSTEPSPLPASSTPRPLAETGPAERRSGGLTGLWGDTEADDTGTPEPGGDATRADADRPSPDADASAAPVPTDSDTGARPSVDAPLAGRRKASRSERTERSEAENHRRRAPSRGKRKVRKVHRVVRHIEVWSLAKLAAVFVACGYVVAMVAGYLLWRAADRVGTIEGIEGFMEDSGGYDTFEILGDVVFRASAAIGLVLAVVTVAVIVLGAILFNLISDLTGGIRMTVIDEDLIVAPARRPPASRPDGPPSPPGPRREPGPPTR